jgi:hypothetical protein
MPFEMRIGRFLQLFAQNLGSVPFPGNYQGTQSGCAQFSGDRVSKKLMAEMKPVALTFVKSKPVASTFVTSRTTFIRKSL